MGRNRAVGLGDRFDAAGGECVAQLRRLYGVCVDAVRDERGRRERVRNLDELERLGVAAVLIDPGTDDEGIEIVERRNADRFPVEVGARLDRRIRCDEELVERDGRIPNGAVRGQHERQVLQMRDERRDRTALTHLVGPGDGGGGGCGSARRRDHLHVESGLLIQARVDRVDDGGEVVGRDAAKANGEQRRLRARRRRGKRKQCEHGERRNESKVGHQVRLSRTAPFRRPVTGLPSSIPCAHRR